MKSSEILDPPPPAFICIRTGTDFGFSLSPPAYESITFSHSLSSSLEHHVVLPLQHLVELIPQS